LKVWSHMDVVLLHEMAHALSASLILSSHDCADLPLAVFPFQETYAFGTRLGENADGSSNLSGIGFSSPSKNTVAICGPLAVAVYRLAQKGERIRAPLDFDTVAQLVENDSSASWNKPVVDAVVSWASLVPPADLGYFAGVFEAFDYKIEFTQEALMDWALHGGYRPALHRQLPIEGKGYWERFLTAVVKAPNLFESETATAIKQAADRVRANWHTRKEQAEVAA
jgi:hypothetical protein